MLRAYKDKQALPDRGVHGGKFARVDYAGDAGWEVVMGTRRISCRTLIEALAEVEDYLRDARPASEEPTR